MDRTELEDILPAHLPAIYLFFTIAFKEYEIMTIKRH